MLSANAGNSTNFANVNNNGNCNYNNASNEAGVRPVAGLLDFTTTQRARPGAAL